MPKINSELPPSPQPDEEAVVATPTQRDATYNGFVELTLEQLEAEELRKAAAARINEAEPTETGSYL